MTATTAERILNAVHDEDPDLARMIANGTKVRELRAAILEIAARVPRSADDLTATEAILEGVAQRFGISPETIAGESRRHEVVRARQVACYVGHLLGMSYSYLGRTLDRDHTTVMHAVSRVGETPNLRAVAQRIATDLGWDRNAAGVI